MSAESQELDAATSQSFITSAGDKYTNVPLIPSLIVSLAGGSITIALAFLLKGVFPHFFSLIMERGPLQFMTVYAFWFTAGMLIFKFKSIQQERKAFELEFLRGFTSGHDMIGTKTMIGEHQYIEENLDPKQKDLILVNRINKAIKQLRINNNPADVANVLKTVADTDAAVMDSSYILIKYMIWAIPILGFIGTILGMTQAIGSFDTVLKGINEIGFAGVKQSLGSVTGGLSVAFETTFLALVLSAIVNLFSNTLQKKEEDILSDVEEFTTENIINKYSSLRDNLRSALPGSSGLTEDPLTTAVQEMIRELKNMNRQQQANADQMMEQLGRVIEAVDGMAKSESETVPEDKGKDLEPVLQEIRDVVKGQADFIKEMNSVAATLQKNIEAFEKIPGTMDAMNETSRKLGDLFGKIYNRSF